MITKNKIIKFISALLIISITTPAVLFSKPKQADALSEIVGGVLGGAFDSGIIPNPLCALSVSVPGIAGLTSVPVSDSVAQGFLCTIKTSTTVNTVIHSWENIFEYVVKEIIKLVAKRLLARMTQATIKWINDDFHGSPLFLENPQSFFRDIAKSELKNMVDEFGYDDISYPFGRQFALNAIDSYKRQFRDNARYTLSKVIRNQDELKLFREDFDYGGWNGFLINTQYPQNNYIGAQMIYTDELARRIEGTTQAPAQKVQDLLQQGMGFLSPQKCPSNPSYNNGFNEFQRPSFKFKEPFNPPPITDEEDLAQREAYNNYIIVYETRRTAAENDFNITNTCPGGLVNTTPGSVVASQISNQLDSPRLMTALDGALGNSIAAIFDALLSHFFDKGLNAMLNIISPKPKIDNWSYDGNTLDIIPDPDDLKIGEQPGAVSVSVKVEETTSERISGGNEDYSIKKLSEIDKKIVLEGEEKTEDTIAIVKINVSGNKLEITGVKKGSGEFTVEDSSNPNQSVAVNVNVVNVGDLMATPANIFIDNISSQVIAEISGGTEPYFIQQNLNGAVAIVEFADTSLIVVGIANGTTSVTIRDSSSPIKTVQVNITVGPRGPIIIPPDVTVQIDQETSVPISNGATPYIVTNQQDIGVATAKILPATPTMLTITGIAPGTSLVTIQDQSSPVKTAEITITTVDNP